MSAHHTYVLDCDGMYPDGAPCESFFIAVYPWPKLLSEVRARAAKEEGWTHLVDSAAVRSGPAPSRDYCRKHARKPR